MLTRARPARIRLKAAADPVSSRLTAACPGGEQPPGLPPGVAEARLALLRAEYARLIAAARASVTAARAGAADPLVYVEAELARHCGLPPQDATVPAVLADAGTAMVLAGRASRPHGPLTAAW
jgi:hypothetical protein